MRHRVGVRLDLREQPALLQHRDDALARLEAVEAVERQDRLEIAVAVSPSRNASLPASCSCASASKMLIGAQLVPPADLEIVEVVRRA